MAPGVGQNIHSIHISSAGESLVVKLNYPCSGHHESVKQSLTICTAWHALLHTSSQDDTSTAPAQLAGHAEGQMYFMRTRKTDHVFASSQHMYTVIQILRYSGPGNRGDTILRMR